MALLKAINDKKKKNNNALSSSYLPPGKTTDGTDTEQLLVLEMFHATVTKRPFCPPTRRRFEKSGFIIIIIV